MSNRQLSAEYRHLSFKQRCIITISAKILNLWFSSCRIKIIGKELHDRYARGEGGAVGATWHRGAIFLVWFFRKFHPMIMFSRSKDGDLLSGFAEKLGVIPIRGSSSKGGPEALEGMKKFLQLPGARKAATVLDGPRGPRCVAKKGMIVLAKEARVPLVPIMMSAYPAFAMKKTWDKTLIPLPFSRITVIYRPPWQITEDMDNEGIEQLREEVEFTLNDMMRQADADTGYRENF
jgi:lysophospholipid acyltransferase (LPLAT)-like uncharacterized protein